MIRHEPHEPHASTPAQHALSPAQQADLARARRAARWAGLYVPLALIAAGTGLILTWIPRLPDPAATHWGFSGGPDGFGSPWTYVWLTGGLGLCLVLLMRLMVVLGGRGGTMPLWSPFQRFMAAFAAGLGAFMTAVGVSSAAVQLDLEDAAEASGIGGLMIASFAAWIGVGLVAWFAQPAVEVRQPAAAPSEPLRLAETERAVWIGEARASRPFLWVIGSTTLLLAFGAAAVFLSSVPAVGWILVGVFVLIAGLALMSLWFGVRIDARGLEARSILGWPVFRLPAADVVSVEAASIAPLAEFGGWGLRWAPGRFGLVLRAGEGIVVRRRDGRIFAITVDDAETGAALLAAAAQAAGGPERAEASGREEGAAASGRQEDSAAPGRRKGMTEDKDRTEQSS